MKKFLIAIAAFLGFSAAQAQESPLWLRYPSISPDGKTIAFTYKGDIYTVPAAGGKAQAVTTNPAYDYLPVWSPDGKTIAFSSDRNGNFDVYTVSAEGGTPTRLTTNSASEYVQTFTPDGKHVVFTASIQKPATNQQFPAAYLTETYSVSVNGGRATLLTSAAGENHFYTKDGKTVFYNDIKGQENAFRKHHTSSVARDIWKWNIPTNTFTQLTVEGAEDRNPVLTADEKTLYYLSENAGSFNVWKMDVASPKNISQVTSFTKDPVRFLSISKNNTLAFSQNGELYTLAQGGKPEKVKVTIVNDSDNQIEKQTARSGLSGAALSPNGKELAIVVRGDIYVTSVEYGTTRRITNTPGQERSPSFSPDGRILVYAGFRNGSWNLYTASIAKADEPYFFAASSIKEETLLDSPDETFQPVFAPKGNEVAFLSDRTKIKVIDTKTKAIRQITDGSKNFSYSDGDIDFGWSPDGKWLTLAYIDKLRQGYNDIGIVSSNGGEIKNITLSGYMQDGPKWMMNGDIILFSSDRFGMRAHGSWGSQRDVMGIFTNKAAFDKSKLSQEDLDLIKEQEKMKKDAEKKVADAKKEKKDDKKKPAKKDEKAAADSTKKEAKPEAKNIKLELNGIEDRIERLTINSSDLSDYVITPDGEKLYYLAAFEGGYDLWVNELRKNETKLVQKLNGRGGSLTLDKDAKNLFVIASSGITKIDIASGSKKPVSFAADEEIDHAAERAYMFEHVYKTVKSKFYRTDLHGCDWEYYKTNYERFLPYIDNNYDFAELLSELLGELNASHTGGRYRAMKENADATARLGLLMDMTYVGEGAKVVEILKDGPFDRETSKVKAGSLLMAIDGSPVKAGEDYYPLLNKKAGKRTMLTFKDDKGSTWDEVIKPISAGAESELMYNRWVENRRAEVEKLSGGRLGYVHIRSMADESFRTTFSDVFGRYNDKDGIVIDTRFNGGGRMHEDIEALFSGTKYLEQVPRGQYVGLQPTKRWTKASIMLMGEANYSNAHGTPWVYKHMNIGKLVGMPVPGTMTSVWWENMQDNSITYGIPIIGYRTKEGNFLENTQLEPDYKVANQSTILDAGRDQQIEEAVKELLKDIDANKSKTW
jgi:tricorn protease